MLLSIVIPVYNVEKYIRHTLESIFSQDVQKNCFEVIIVDDETPDNSMAVVEEFSFQHNNIKIIHQKNKGLSGARNAGLTKTTGDYVWFVDSDDKLASGSLQHIFNTIHNHPDVDLYGFGIYTEDEDTGRRKYVAPLGLWTKNHPYERPVDYSVMGNHTIGPTARYVFRRDLLTTNHLQFWQGKLHEDVDFLNKSFFLAKNIWLEQQPIYIYLERSCGSIMSTIRMKSFYDLLDICHSFGQIRQEHINDHKARLYWDAVMWRTVTIMQNPKMRGHALAESDIQEYNTFIKDNRAYFRTLTFRGIIASIKTKAWKDTLLALRNINLSFGS